MTEAASTTEPRPSSLRRNLVLLASYLVLLALIGAAYV